MRPATVAASGLLLATALRLEAQGTPASASSPLLPCCHLSADGLVPIADSLAGVLRATGLASSLHDLRTAVPSRRVVLSGSRRSGAWHRPQEPAAVAHVDAGAAGWRSLGAWTAAGSAVWRRQREDEVRWRNTSDAYLGSPYIWADNVGGTWRSDVVTLTAAVGSPAWRGLRLGLGSDYAIGQGARRNASRPLYRRRVLELTPALTWTLGAHELAAGLTRGWHREDLEVGGGSFGDPTIVRLRGISTFDRTQLISAERAVLGDVTGAVLGYAWRGRRWTSSLAWRRRVELDSVRDGIARPEFGGASRRVRQDARGVVRRTGHDGGVEGLLMYATEAARGTDPIFRAVNQLDNGSRGELLLSLWRGATLPTARWLAAIDGTVQSLDRRDVVGETRWSAQLHEAGIRALHRRAIGGLTVITGARAAITGVSASDYLARRPSELTPILAEADFAMVSAPRRTVDAILGVEWGHGAAGGATGRARVEGVLATSENTRAADAARRTRLRLILELF